MKECGNKYHLPPFPPQNFLHPYSSNVNAVAAQVNKSIEVIVLATNGAGVASRTSTEARSGNRAALNADLTGDAPDRNAEETEK